MLIGIEAKFNEVNEAKKAFKLIEDKVEVDLLQVLTVDKISQYKSSERDESMRKGLMSMTAIGGIIGGITGAMFDFVVNFYSLLEPYQDFYQSAFILCGLIVGMLCAILIYFINREDLPPISVEDINNKQALIVIKVSKKELDSVVKLLENTNAQSIHTI